MRKYTETIHAGRLLKMLNKKDPCMWCPAAKRYDAKENAEILWDWDSEPCRICSDFLGLEYKETLMDSQANPTNYNCPCNRMDKAKAIKITWAALKEKGFTK